jgi:hypothetical protein
MEPNQAAEHLQTIRTLMERSAIYRRALAPIMTYCGAVGIAGGVAGHWLPMDSARAFVLFWAAVAAVALTGTFLLVRRQSLKDAETFWSPPTRRVTQALIPALVVGAFLGVMAGWLELPQEFCAMLAALWFLLYGLAIHAAGFFMPRGLKLFGWWFLLIGCLIFQVILARGIGDKSSLSWLMGGLFGGSHLAYGIYLYFTEKRRKAT